jgi:hypothetical protein
MLMRAAVLYVLFVFASMATAIAVWQSGEVKWRNVRLAESAKSEDALRHELQAAKDASLLASRRARLAEQTAEELSQSRSASLQELEIVKANLAAARQQASVAETAMTETEDRLAAEIAAHANLKAETTAALDRVKSGAVVSTGSVNATVADPPRDSTNLNSSNVAVGHIETPDVYVPSAATPAATTTAATTPTAVPEAQPLKPVAAVSVETKAISAGPDTPPAHNAGGIEKKKSADGSAVKKKVKPKTLAKRPPAKKTVTGSASADFPF